MSNLAQIKRRLVQQRARTSAALDREAPCWPAMMQELGHPANADQVAKRMDDIIAFYFSDLEIGPMTVERARNLAQIVKKCRALHECVKREADWMNAYFNDEIIEASLQQDGTKIKNGDDDDSTTFSEFADRIDEIMSATFVESTSRSMYARRRAWVSLSFLYESTTGKRIAVSRGREHDIDGPFVRFLLAFSRAVICEETITREMIDSFVDWFRSDKSEYEQAELAPRAGVAFGGV